MDRTAARFLTATMGFGTAPRYGMEGGRKAPTVALRAFVGAGGMQNRSAVFVMLIFCWRGGAPFPLGEGRGEALRLLLLSDLNLAYAAALATDVHARSKFALYTHTLHIVVFNCTVNTFYNHTLYSGYFSACQC